MVPACDCNRSKYGCYTCGSMGKMMEAICQLGAKDGSCQLSDNIILVCTETSCCEEVRTIHASKVVRLGMNCTYETVLPNKIRPGTDIIRIDPWCASCKRPASMYGSISICTGVPNESVYIAGGKAIQHFIYTCLTCSRSTCEQYCMNCGKQPVLPMYSIGDSTMGSINVTLCVCKTLVCRRAVLKLLRQFVEGYCTGASLARECAQCRVVPEKVLLCGRCKVVCYCGKECQRLHWPTHKIGCVSVETSS